MFDKKFFIAFIFSFLLYSLFFYNIFQPSYSFWGSDAQKKHIPARYYLYEKIVNDHSFPFWTERVFMGFPIYADFENAYLHPINVASILVFGPLLSYKILHLGYYLLGSMSLYIFLKRKKAGIIGFLVSNSIFFFSSFLINHQIHFNIILSFYLLPLSILFTDLFVEKHKIKYIFLQSLVLSNSLLWGHPQSFLIMLMCVFLYLIFFLRKDKKIKILLFYFFSTAILCFSFTSFQLLPSAEFFKNAYREDNFRYTQGSLPAPMLIFTFIPYLFNTNDTYIGKSLDADFSYTEIYIYVGISSIFLYFLGVLFLKNRRIVLFGYSCMWVFLILSSLSYANFIPNDLWIISMFRYWVRSVILLIFGVSVISGLYVSKIYNIPKINVKILAKRLLLFCLPLLYFFYLIIDNQDSATLPIVFKTLKSNLRNYPYYNFLLLISLCLLVLNIVKLFILKIKFQNFIKILILIVVVIDLRFFGTDVINFRLNDTSSFKMPESISEFENQRTLNKSDISHMEYLYIKDWSLFGYSQFVDKDYIQFLKSISIDNERALNLKNIALTKVAESTGIIAKYENKEITPLNSKAVPLIYQNNQAKYIVKKEGKISFEIVSEVDQKINTFIKYDPNWSIVINGVPQKHIKNGILNDINISKGVSIVTFEYVPRYFYLGVVLSLCILSFTFLFYKYKKEEVEIFLKK
ncbi:hypothetical protein KA001_01730 [Patescibacteria group bacterium]|nr:hypothetical protein [Patescibacteria group bacterium]